MAGSPMSGLGSIQMWGLSPARNLTNFMTEAAFTEASGKGHLNILLFGEADLRHSLKTLSNHWKSSQGNSLQFNFYVVENSLDLFARQLVLWSLAFEALEDKGLHEKTIQFMDLFGNLLIRPQTKKYLKLSLEKLIKLVTDDPEMKAEYPLFNFSQLKYRERDQIVEILKFWLKNLDATKFDVTHLWDARLRQHLTTRYDARLGVFDWDYNMNLIERGTNAGIISMQEYKTWRSTGIGFAEFEADYSQPNLTLTIGATTPRHNYWGEIMTGPFISLGIECEDSGYFSKTNKEYKKRSFDVTQHNLESIFATISPKTREERRESVAGSKFEVHFVSPSSLPRLIQNAKFKCHFQLVYFANSMIQYLKTSNITEVMTDDCMVVVEDASFVLELKNEEMKIFDEKVLEIARDAELEVLEAEPEASPDNEGKEKGDNARQLSTKYFKRFHKQQQISENSSIPTNIR